MDGSDRADFFADSGGLGTVAAQLQESKSRTLALLSLGWSLLLAWLMALVVFQGGRLLGFG